MNRRQGIFGGLASIIGMTGGKAVVAKAADGLVLSDAIVLDQKRYGVTFPIDGYAFYKFTFDGQTVTLTPKEVFEAIRA